MKLLSEIVSKPVLDLFSGKIRGTVKSVLFDETFKKVTHLVMFDEDEEEYKLNSQKIYAIGENAVVIKNEEALTLCINQNNYEERNLINKNVYTIFGNYLGKISDIEFDDKMFVKNFYVENIKFEQKQILNIGQDIIINQSNKNVRLCDLKPKIKPIKTQQIVTIMPKIVENEVVDPKPEEQKNIELETPKPIYKVATDPTPKKVFGNGDFLIGRKASKTIYGINNEIIIKKENLISTKNLELAKKHGKLMELAVFSKIKS